MKNTLKSSTKKLMLFALPIISNNLIGIIPLLASIWILSRLGKIYLATVAITSPTYYTILTIFITGFSAVGIKVSYSFGKKQDFTEIGKWVKNGLWLAFILSIPGMAILFNAHFLLRAFKQQPELISLSKPFFFYSAFAIVPILFNTVLNQYFCGIRHPKIAFILSICMLLPGIALSYLLILGRMGLPKLGLGGISCASLISSTMVMCCAIAIAIYAPWSRPYRIFSIPFQFDYRRCIELLKLGWPISIQVSGELSALTVGAYLLGLFGSSALAAAQITQQYILVFVMIAMGLSQSLSILVSHAYGEMRIKQIKQLTIAALMIMTIVALLFSIGFITFPDYLVHWYLNINKSEHTQLTYYAVHFMWIAAVYLIFDGMRNIFTAALRGLHDSKLPMQIGIFCLWFIGLPAAYIGGFILNGGPIAFRACFTFSVIIGAIWLMNRYIKRLNKKL